MKAFWTLLTSIFIVIVLSFSFLFFKSNYVIGRLLSSTFHSKVTIDHVGYTKKEIQIQEFTLYNPSEYTTPKALFIKNIDINAPYSNYLKKIIQIHEIEIHDAVLNFVFNDRKGSESNWSHLIGNLSNEKQPDDITKDDSQGRYAVIDLLTINQLTVNIMTPGKKTETKVLKNLQFKHVVTKKGDITRRITQVVLYHMLFDYQNLIKIPAQFADKASTNFFHLFQVPSVNQTH